MKMQVLCGALALLLHTCGAFPATTDTRGALADLDNGLQWKFADFLMATGEVYTGEIIGVYNEVKFMWNPTDHSTLSIFTCSDAVQSLGDFSVTPGDDPAIFSLTTSDIVTITLRDQPGNLVEYQAFMRQHGHVFSHVPVEGEIWISRAWDSYHAWEDGRGNYAWDIGALNSNMMSYERYGTRNNDFEVFGKNVILPMDGKIVTVNRAEVDNVPDIDAGINIEDNSAGSEVDLEEKPQNLVELQVGGDASPFLLRLIHQKQNSIANTIMVGNSYTAGTVVGQVGNSGTTYVPHLHAVFGFTDTNNRFWALPVEWASVAHRTLLAYPSGYQYGQYHHHDYFYPKFGNCVTN